MEGSTAFILELILNTPIFRPSRWMNNLRHSSTHADHRTEWDAWTDHLDYG